MTKSSQSCLLRTIQSRSSRTMRLPLSCLLQLPKFTAFVNAAAERENRARASFLAHARAPLNPEKSCPHTRQPAVGLKSSAHARSSIKIGGSLAGSERPNFPLHTLNLHAQSEALASEEVRLADSLRPRTLRSARYPSSL